MTREALERALEALENAILDYSMGKGAVARHIEAITAIEQALAAQQEPVAWEQELANILCRIHRDGGHYVAEHGWRKAIDDADLKVAQLNAAFDTTTPAAQINSTTSAAQREWVGLTPDEFQFIYDNCLTPSNLIDMVEAKLKEKNNA